MVPPHECSSVAPYTSGGAALCFKQRRAARAWLHTARALSRALAGADAGDGVIAATDGRASASKFTARRDHRVLPDIGHNLPQEAPEAFAGAIMELIKA